MLVPALTSPLNFTLRGSVPPTVRRPPALKFSPVIISAKLPAASRSTEHPRITAISLFVAVAVLQVNVTRIPCSLPIAHPAGAVLKFRLVPFGPLTKIRNVLPAFAVPKLNNASIRFGLSITNLCACITLFGFAASTANTDVTFAVPFGRMKHAPVMMMSCGFAQSTGPDGDAEITTGALRPRSSTHVVVRVNPPVVSRLKMLLLPAVNVTVAFIVAKPPQQVSGKAVPGSCGTSDCNVPRTRFGLTGVTAVNGIARSGTPSPLVSHLTHNAVVTVLPGRCSGIPV